MGIKKLHKVLIQDKDCFESVSLRQSTVVIDGYCFCYCLHSDIAGSNYCQFYQKVYEYFRALKEYGLDMYIVLDGVNKKLKTKENRCQARLQKLAEVDSEVERLSALERVLPLMAKVVFLDAIHDLSTASVVKFFVADGEADRDAVSLANHLCCPVLGNDSDFYVFNIESGYIPVVNSQHKLIDLMREVQCFKYHLFDRKYGLRSPRVRLLLPFCLGNDFSGSNHIPQLGVTESTSAEDILSKLDGVNIDEYSTKLRDYQTFYEISPCPFEQLSTSRCLCELNHSLPEWVISYYKSGKFLNNTTHFLLGTEKKLWRYMVVIEDLSRESAWDIIEPILPYIAGVLLSHTPEPPQLIVKESRIGRSCSFFEKPIELHDKHTKILASQNLITLQNMPLSERIRVLIRVFHCKAVSKTLEKVPDEFKLVVIATRCWLIKIDTQKVQLDKAFVLALVFCLRTCFRSGSDEGCHGNHPMSRLCRVHCLAQWECMWYLVITFNQILDYPFQYTSPGRLFSTKIFEGLFLRNPDILRSTLDETGSVMFHAMTKEISFFG